MSSNVIIHTQHNGSLEYNPSAPCVIGRFTGFMSSDEFRTFLMQGLDCCVKYRKGDEDFMWLADTSKHSIQPKEDTEWVATDWNPEAIKNGIMFVGFILPENVFGELSVKNYMNATKKSANKGELNIGMFGTESAAIEWFQSLTKGK